jgi:hypothetical protein
MMAGAQTGVAIVVGAVSVLAGVTGVIGTRAWIRRPTTRDGDNSYLFWSLGILAVLPAWLVVFVYLIPSSLGVRTHATGAVLWLCSNLVPRDRQAGELRALFLIPLGGGRGGGVRALPGGLRGGQEDHRAGGRRGGLGRTDQNADVIEEIGRRCGSEERIGARLAFALCAGSRPRAELLVRTWEASAAAP